MILLGYEFWLHTAWMQLYHLCIIYLESGSSPPRGMGRRRQTHSMALELVNIDMANHSSVAILNPALNALVFDDFKIL
jgi:hypothetical protein